MSSSRTETADGVAARWFHRPVPRPEARLRLVCVPYAGAGAGVYREWAAGLPSDVELVATRLPGRENRVREEPYTTWNALAPAFSTALRTQVRAPYVLFGHSMGGMLAYEAVTRETGHLPERVIISGCRAPHVPRAVPAVHDLPDDEFADGLARLAGTPPEVLAAPGLLAMLTPMLRADLRLAETWSQDRPRPRPVPVPLTTLRGTEDEVAPAAAVAAWQPLASRGLRSHDVPGGHFFLHDAAEIVLRLLHGELAPRTRPHSR